MPDDAWSYFDYANIRQEVRARLAQARKNPAKLTPETDTLEYWCAWVAHANAASVFIKEDDEDVLRAIHGVRR